MGGDRGSPVRSTVWGQGDDVRGVLGTQLVLSKAEGVVGPVTTTLPTGGFAGVRGKHTRLEPEVRRVLSLSAS